MSLAVRKAAPVGRDPDDFDAMKKKSRMSRQAPVPVGAYSDDLLEALMPSTYVATKDGEVVGFVTAHTLTDRVERLEKRVGLQVSRVPKLEGRVLRKDVLKFVNIKVKYTRQGGGIGKRLVRHVLDKVRHKIVDYETPYAGKHVNASCCSAQEYTCLQRAAPAGTYDNGATAHRFTFRRD